MRSGSVFFSFNSPTKLSLSFFSSVYGETFSPFFNLLSVLVALLMLLVALFIMVFIF